MTDADARRWMEKVFRLNQNYVLVLKHFEKGKLPPTSKDTRCQPVRFDGDRVQMLR